MSGMEAQREAGRQLRDKYGTRHLEEAVAEVGVEIAGMAAEGAAAAIAGEGLNAVMAGAGLNAVRGTHMGTHGSGSGEGAVSDSDT